MTECLVYKVLLCNSRVSIVLAITLFFFFYKNIEAEICEMLNIFNKAEAEILNRIDIILCVETSLNTIQFYAFNLTV